MKNIIDESFSINLKLLKLMGLYTPKTPTFGYKVHAYVTYFCCIILVTILMILGYILKEDVDLMGNNYNAAYLGQMLCFTAKLFPFIRSGDQIKRCIYFFSDPNFSAFTDKRKEIIDNCVKICRRMSIAFAVAIAETIVFWCTRPMFSRNKKVLIMDIWVPFNTAKSSVYYSIYGFLAISSAYTGFAMMVDPLIGGLAYHAATQLQVLQYSLQHIGEGCISAEIIDGRIRQCIEHHSSIMSFVNLFQDCFSTCVFSQFVMSSLIICFLILQMGMMEISGFDYFLIIFCIFLVLGQLGFYCYFGTILFEENYSLTSAVYMGRWYEYDVKSRKFLLILMERSKRPMIITAGKILDLSLGTFTTILRRSYSLLAVLKNY